MVSWQICLVSHFGDSRSAGSTDFPKSRLLQMLTLFLFAVVTISLGFQLCRCLNRIRKRVSISNGMFISGVAVPDGGTPFSKFLFLGDFGDYMIRTRVCLNPIDPIREIQPSLQVPRAETRVERFTARQHVWNIILMFQEMGLK